MAPEAILLTGMEDYLPKLRQAYVLVDPEERGNWLHRAVEALADKAGGKVLADEKLLQEVNFLVEFPDPVFGAFDPEFLKLPPEVLITSMKEHQRYSPIVDGIGICSPISSPSIIPG